MVVHALSCSRVAPRWPHRHSTWLLTSSHKSYYRITLPTWLAYSGLCTPNRASLCHCMHLARCHVILRLPRQQVLCLYNGSQPPLVCHAAGRSLTPPRKHNTRRILLLRHGRQVTPCCCVYHMALTMPCKTIHVSF